MSLTVSGSRQWAQTVTGAASRPQAWWCNRTGGPASVAHHRSPQSIRASSTPVSRLIYLAAFQAIPLTRIMPPHRYRAERLRPPAEVAAALAAADMTGENVCGFRPRSIGALVRAVLARKSGRLRDEDLPAVVEFVLDPGHEPVVTYLGAARKPR